MTAATPSTEVSSSDRIGGSASTTTEASASARPAATAMGRRRTAGDTSLTMPERARPTSVAHLVDAEGPPTRQDGRTRKLVLLPTTPPPAAPSGPPSKPSSRPCRRRGPPGRRRAAAHRELELAAGSRRFQYSPSGRPPLDNVRNAKRREH